MSIAVRLRDCVSQACNLLGCIEGYILLRCDDPSLRHPLLNTLPAHLTHAISLTGQFFSSHLASSEPVAAICDIAIYTGKIWCIDQIALPGSTYMGSIAVAPLTHPLGILGHILFIDTREAAFLQGECLLLEQFLSQCVQRIVDILQEQHYYNKPQKDSHTLDHGSQDELISLVSHELRGPLTAIKGYIELLRAYSFCDEQNEYILTSSRLMTRAHQQRYLESISEQAQQLEVLTGDLLDVSRLQAGHLALHCMSIDLAYICQRVTRFMQDSVEQQSPASYTIRCHIHTTSTRAWADPHRVQQILTNLLENAVKYSPDGGLIEVTLMSSTVAGLRDGQQTRASKTLSVTVKDQGIGIPFQQQYALFKPFSRIEQSTTRSISGCGLGLYIARNLIEAMNGQVSLQSCEGAGTSITFTLPAEM